MWRRKLSDSALASDRIEFLRDARRRSGQHQLTAVRNRDHPLIEAGSGCDDFAEAPEAIGRLRTPHRSDRIVQVIRRHPLSQQFPLCADGLTTALGAVRAPEIERRARRAQFDFNKDGSRHQLKQRFQFTSGAIDSRHYRDSHRTDAVGKRRSGYLESLACLFDSRDRGDFPRAQRYLINRFDLSSQHHAAASYHAQQPRHSTDCRARAGPHSQPRPIASLPAARTPFARAFTPLD